MKERMNEDIQSILIRHKKSDAINQTTHLCFRKNSTIGQLNVTAATAENEEQCTLSNIICIEFQNVYFFL